MISNAMFITYTIMCFLGLQAITLIVILTKRNDAGNRNLMKATRNFVVISFALGLYYYITYYRELVLGEFATGPVVRGFDGVIFYAMGYSWIKLVDNIAGVENDSIKILRKHTRVVFPCLMVLSAIVYIFVLDAYYNTDSFVEEVITIVSEALLGIVVIWYTCKYVSWAYRELVDSASRKYIMVVSIFVCFNNLWNNCVAAFVFIKAVSLSVMCSNLYAVTSILLLITNLLTLCYVYKKDFTPIFFGHEEKGSKNLTEEEAVDMVARDHKLTERERDVMLLAYEGLTNPDIAEKLFISRHTVKRYMHNIFEKLDVSTRMELAHLVQSQMNSGK